MRRADRLFQIIQILRRARAADDRAGASPPSWRPRKRTVYRDIADLIGQRVPIRGEAGIGYVLDGGFDMPPLMLTPDEIEAAVLGAQWVAGRGDPALARAARDLIAKIAAAVPERLRPFVLEPADRRHAAGPPGARRARPRPAARLDPQPGARSACAIATSRGARASASIWPVADRLLRGGRACWPPGASCAQDFRHFRTDRVVEAAFLDERYPERPAALRAAWRKTFATRAPSKEEPARRPLACWVRA